MVKSNPSLSVILGNHPNSLILLISNIFLGVPSGKLSFHLTSPLKSTESAIRLAKSFILISFPEPTFKKDNLLPFSFFGDFSSSGFHFSKAILQALARSDT